MGMLDGWPEQALKDFGGDFRPGVLHVSAEGADDGQGGFTEGATTDHACLALVADYSDYRRQSLGIPATDRLILVLAASLPAGVVPAKGDGITADDPANGLQPALFEVIAKTGDLAGALFKVQGR